MIPNRSMLAAILSLLPLVLSACISYEWKSSADRTTSTWGFGTGGAVGFWILANISYAGMRAQAHPSVGWRVLTFLVGLPGTILTILAVKEGSGRVFGIVLPVPNGRNDHDGAPAGQDGASDRDPPSVV